MRQRHLSLGEKPIPKHAVGGTTIGSTLNLQHALRYFSRFVTSRGDFSIVSPWTLCPVVLPRTMLDRSATLTAPLWRRDFEVTMAVLANCHHLWSFFLLRNRMSELYLNLKAAFCNWKMGMIPEELALHCSRDSCGPLERRERLKNTVLVWCVEEIH